MTAIKQITTELFTRARQSKRISNYLQRFTNDECKRRYGDMFELRRSFAYTLTTVVRFLFFLLTQSAVVLSPSVNELWYSYVVVENYTGL